jgi:DNA-binding LacI/PurR family transcriptional regulator
MKLTINEIAELAQVAKSTVSKALNGQKGVSDEKRKIILRLAEQLDYHPNASAQALALNRSGSIGFVLPHQAGLSLSGAYWSAIITAVAQEARSRNYNLLILSPGPDDDIGAPIDAVLKRRNVDGLIIGAEHLDAKAVSTLILEEIPFVLIGRSPNVRHYSVDVDNEAASRKIVSHLASKGRGRIACLAGPREHPYTQERVEGYRSALRGAGLEWSAVEYSDYELAEVTRTLGRLLESHPDIDALYMTAGGEFVLDAIDVLKGRKGDLAGFSMAVFDDYRFFDYLSIPISRLRQPLSAIGARSATLLFDIMEGCKPERLEWVLEAEAVLR